MKRIIFFIFAFLLFGFNLCYCQIDYKIGDIVNESIPVYDTENGQTNLKIPANYYLLVYRYRWVDIGRGVDNSDSIRELENKIDRILLSGEITNLKVVCLSYDAGINYPKWIEHIKKGKLFRVHPNYKVMYYNTNNFETEKKCQKIFTKVTIFGPEGRIVRFSPLIAKFDYNLKSNDVSVQGKLVTTTNGVKEPLSNAMVHLESGNNDTIAKGKTNMYGDFKLNLPNNNKDYTLKVQPPNKSVTNVLLLTRGGREITTLTKSQIGLEFGYHLLKSDVITLSEFQEEDITLKYEDFYLSKNKELITNENIFYDVSESAVREESKKILDKIVTILNNNPTVKIEIVSHTDAQGEDASNMKLSEKRANTVLTYLVMKGISEKRLKAIGKGETQIRNRCTNGISCSDKEHEYNRRTEFRYTKS